MNKLFLCLIFTAATFMANSQRVYFVYLQSEQEQPFFVKWNDKIYNSSASGYLIIPKLRDSSYQFTVGFPQQNWPEQKFSVTINAKDHGYLLKYFGEKGWGLFNLQTLAVQMASSEPPTQPIPPAKTAEVSRFTDILAKAADDSLLREKPTEILAKTEDKKGSTKTVVTDTVVAMKDEIISGNKQPEMPKPSVDLVPTDTKADSVRAVIKEQPVTKMEEQTIDAKEPPAINTVDVPASGEKEYKKSVVTRRSESSTTEGFGLTYIDEYADGVKDTIRILIPNPKKNSNPTKDTPKDEKKFLDITTDTAANQKPQQVEEAAKINTEVKTQSHTDTVTATKSVETANSNCKAVADETDFLKLRKSMAAVETDDDMLDEAKKYFKTKCFSTTQIKNLVVLFLTDAGKYKFFDLAYFYVSDPGAFPALQAELKEDYYINRFKAMLRN